MQRCCSLAAVVAALACGTVEVEQSFKECKGKPWRQAYLEAVQPAVLRHKSKRLLCLIPLHTAGFNTPQYEP